MTSFGGILNRPGYRQLLIAQVVALLGTGLLTVALSLLAFDVAPGSAGAVVATALTIKMVAYVGVAPAITAVTASLPPRVVLVGADVVRLLVAATLPWVDQVWQIYVLIFILQAASATFTPTYQALLPTVLPHREDYTRALSLSRVAYDLEAVLSPLMAALALLVISYHGLFVGTALGFVASAVLVLRSREGTAATTPSSAPFRQRLTAGLGLFARHRPLRAVLLLDLAAFGAGSMLVALTLPRVLRTRSERQVMLVGSFAVAVALTSAVVVTAGEASWPGVLVVWFLLGAAGSAVLTPTGQVITATVTEEERPAAFAAHFSLSHACYLLAYPVAGWVGSHAGLPASAAVLAAVASVATIVAAITWSAHERTTARA